MKVTVEAIAETIGKAIGAVIVGLVGAVIAGIASAITGRRVAVPQHNTETRSRRRPSATTSECLKLYW